MSDHELLEQFVAVTGATKEQAKFFVDAAAGDINAAVTSYLEDNAESSPSSMPGAYVEDEDSGASRPITPATAGRAKAKPPASRSGINTLGSLQSESSDEAEKPAEYYTGGEKSGLGVIDPRKKKDDSNPSNLIQELLRKAAAGSQDPTQPEASASSFRGSGYTLGSEEEESQKVQDPNEAFKRAMAQQPEKVTRALKLWQDGFSVDDGRLYRYDDPANKDYLEAINKGHAPLALLNVSYGQPVDVRVEKRTDEPYAPPPKVFKPFESSGHRLGSDVPVSASVSSAPAPATSQAAASSSEAAPVMDVDTTAPTTSLQIRLAAGGRIVTTLNTSHTLSDVYDFVARHPATGGRPFLLMTPYPRKEYAKNTTSIEQAGLMKGVLQQKFE